MYNSGALLYIHIVYMYTARKLYIAEDGTKLFFIRKIFNCILPKLRKCDVVRTYHNFFFAIHYFLLCDKKKHLSDTHFSKDVYNIQI